MRAARKNNANFKRNFQFEVSRGRREKPKSGRRTSPFALRTAPQAVRAKQSQTWEKRHTWTRPSTGGAAAAESGMRQTNPIRPDAVEDQVRCGKEVRNDRWQNGPGRNKPNFTPNGRCPSTPPFHYSSILIPCRSSQVTLTGRRTGRESSPTSKPSCHPGG
jgi:hypothetical protein